MVNADLINRLIVAFNAHDAAVFAGAFTEDGVMYAYPEQVAGRGPGEIKDYISKMFDAFPKVKVGLLGRIDLGMRQITHERFDRGDGSRTPTQPGSSIPYRKREYHGSILFELRPDD